MQIIINWENRSSHSVGQEDLQVGIGVMLLIVVRQVTFPLGHRWFPLRFLKGDFHVDFLSELVVSVLIIVGGRSTPVVSCDYDDLLG
jgi:hypothetical protein